MLTYCSQEPLCSTNGTLPPDYASFRHLHGVSRRRPYASGRSTRVPFASSTCPLSWRWPRPKSTNTQLYSGHSCASVGSLSAPQRPVPSGRPVASPVAVRLSGLLAPWLGLRLGLGLGLGIGLGLGSGPGLG